MKTLKEFVAENKSFDFDILDGPKTLRTRGASIGQKGNDPKDALIKNYTDNLGCENVVVTPMAQDVYKVVYNYPGDRNKTTDYYKLR